MQRDYTQNEAIEASQSFEPPSTRVSEQVLYYEGNRPDEAGIPATIVKIEHKLVTLAITWAGRPELDHKRGVCHADDPRRPFPPFDKKGYWKKDPEGWDVRVTRMEAQLDKALKEMKAELKAAQSFSEMLAEEVSALKKV